MGSIIPAVSCVASNIYRTTIERLSNHYQTIIEHLLYHFQSSIEPHRTPIEPLSNVYRITLNIYWTFIKQLFESLSNICRIIFNDSRLTSHIFLQRRFIVCGYSLWQTNLIEMCIYMRFNRDYYYTLTVIYVLSKHAWIMSLKRGNEGEDNML